MLIILNLTDADRIINSKSQRFERFDRVASMATGAYADIAEINWILSDSSVNRCWMWVSIWWRHCRATPSSRWRCWRYWRSTAIRWRRSGKTPSSTWTDPCAGWVWVEARSSATANCAGSPRGSAIPTYRSPVASAILNSAARHRPSDPEASTSWPRKVIPLQLLLPLLLLTINHYFSNCLAAILLKPLLTLLRTIACKFDYSFKGVPFYRSSDDQVPLSLN